jgi:uncharacterized protein YdaU (DUF1376 family)
MKIRRVDFYPDDWLAGVVQLDDVERGVYITICALIYANGGPITYDALKAASLSHGNRLNRCLRHLETLGKILRNGSEIDQKRCEKELKRRRKIVRKFRESGSKGGNIKALRLAPATPPALAIKGDSLANNLQSTTNKEESSSFLPASARACVPAGGAAHAHDTEHVAIATNGSAWKQLGSILGQPASPAPVPNAENLHALRQQQHMEFLRTRGGSELDLYLAAQMSDDTDAAQRMFDLTDERMRADGHDPGRE